MPEGRIEDPLGERQCEMMKGKEGREQLMEALSGMPVNLHFVLQIVGSFKHNQLYILERC